MIERKGTHICERCGKQYEWIARKLEQGLIYYGRIDAIKSINIYFFDVIGKRLIATSRCPFCRAKQIKNLVDEEL